MKRHSGFSLIEIVIAAAIVLILAGVLIPRSGLPTAIGTAEDTLNRVPSSATVGVTKIVFKTVDQTDITALDVAVDAGDGATTGAIQWTTTPLVMYYVIPLNNKC